MAVDDSRLIFNSNWELDQILMSGTTNHTFNSEGWSEQVEILDFSGLNLSYTPMFYISWRRQGETRWNLQGASSGMDDSTSTPPPYPVAKNSKIYIYGGLGTAEVEFRYIIYKSRAVPEEES